MEEWAQLARDKMGFIGIRIAARGSYQSISDRIRFKLYKNVLITAVRHN